jgi:hypothetical protein
MLCTDASICALFLLLVQFHAAEYPAFSNNTFPILLGHCQKHSTSVYHPRAMDLRNILWYQVRHYHTTALGT